MQDPQKNTSDTLSGGDRGIDCGTAYTNSASVRSLMSILDSMLPEAFSILIDASYCCHIILHPLSALPKHHSHVWDWKFWRPTHHTTATYVTVRNVCKCSMATICLIFSTDQALMIHTIESSRCPVDSSVAGRMYLEPWQGQVSSSTLLLRLPSGKLT